MSHVYYNELWLITRSDLEKLLELERRLQESTPLKKGAALNSALFIYLRYRNIVRRLIMCYDQMVQTQKRELIKKMLECAIGRMLEYKKEIVKLDYMDYQWPDDILNQMKFTPDDIELFAAASGRERVEERIKFIQELIESAHKVPQTRERSLSQIHIESMSEMEDQTLKTRAARRRMRIMQPSKVELIRESPEEKAAREAKLAAERIMRSAILLIQSHERARKGRCYGADVKRIYDYNKKVRFGEIIPRKIDRIRYIKSAVTIQRAWRRYASRKAMRKRIARLEDALGMTIPSWQCRKTRTKDDDNFQRRRALMPVFDAHTKKAISDERTRLLKVRGPGLMEDITDEIHEWFVVWYNALGHYDVFPAADFGGSVLIVTGQTSTPQEYLMEKLEKEKQAKAKGRRAEKMAPRPKAEPIKSQVPGWKMPQTDALSCLEEANIDFIRNWSFRSEKPSEREYLDLITEKLCYELQLEMREIVDDVMRAELDVLNKALLKDHAYDKEKFTIPTMDKNIDKTGTKRKKDILEDVAVEDLFSELLRAKIIRNYPTIFLRDWFGDLSYQNYEARREFRDFKHRLGEVKQLVLEYCILPLISKGTHQVAPLVRSVCIYGLPGAGKTSLANVICSEIGALLFDVSAPVLTGKYMGKEKQQRLIDIISKVARVYAPSIIFLDAGEKPWLKKVPPEEKYLQHKRFANYFVKLMKGIKSGDQILFLSLSEEPQKATAGFNKFHDKFIRVPTTDYNTLYMYYKNLLMKYHGVDRDIDVSCLAKMSVGIPLNFIRQAVEKVLSLRRRITLKFNPLSPIEIMNEILTYQYPTTEMVESLDKFEKLTLSARRKTKVS
ncbi:IQ and AAA domain-containing protein 1-like isoform X1 [Temnothorax curvispinosus]|uniref:IQ and AAA domain-containing protein 1-like isoform X1 n=2 Tax=Temnothorax curvispinosus TaxID=300111 RepID=A0A6J1Q814_9HYME|nr:IQ and AAA domain-containing protein 1-like isoform X1 [Temnothorax curvispinosus]